MIMTIIVSTNNLDWEHWRDGVNASSKLGGQSAEGSGVLRGGVPLPLGEWSGYGQIFVL